MRVVSVAESEYPELVELWEASVRATHDFLTEKDIQFFKPLILNQYLHAVELRCVRGVSGGILGFIGVADGNIEMLFVSPQSRGKGVGSTLTKYAIKKLGVTSVDVNEQNPAAKGFYEHMGFKVSSRSPVDNTGRPYPILHLKLPG
ncbi:GNAT family N-acetyltransferase [Lentisphaerota bacterium ZTH]|nr:GNAT family N-acetyltransferase [Lentisphaerota bacterium]WET05987.1 GNAT family N-acetyltransferase [Lentisphaerota bacterium ZTH]